MNKAFSFLSTLAGLSLTFVSAQAQSQELKAGAQASLSLPFGDIAKSGCLDHAPGVGLGAHLIMAYQRGHAVIPRVDCTHFRKSGKRKIDMFQLGLDYNYFVSGEVNKGLYFGTGLGFAIADFKSPQITGDSNSFYTTLSGGCLFTKHLGTEIRYSWAQYEPLSAFSDQKASSHTVQTSVLYRF